ncbi:MAG: hypothetical protein JWP00_3635 [Chloroflexi bacterium]|jgi:hypothetical protein|nr:hypothetical protein [Chloroflexota bacterium]
MNNLPPTMQTQNTPKTPVIVWWQALGFMVAGSLLTILLLVLWLVLFTGVPVNTTALTLPPPSGKADLTAQVSQEYVNREVAAILNRKPVSILGVVEVKQVVVQFNPNSVLDSNVRVTALGRQFDFIIKNTVEVRGNRVTLKLKEDPKLGGLGLPVGVLSGVVDQVNNSVADQLNKLVISVGQARDCTTGEQIGRVPTLQALDLQPGVLNAQFSIAITK